LKEVQKLIDIYENLDSLSNSNVRMQLKEIIENLKVNNKPKEKWIPVTERLPETGRNVLVCDNEELITRGCYLDYEDDSKPFWVTDADEGYSIGKIVAWMPLPEPYKE